MKKDTDELRQEYELKAMPHLLSGPEYLEYRRKRQGMPGKAVFLEPDEIPAKPIIYPDSDGQPIAENTRQFDWIVTQIKDLVLPDHGAEAKGNELQQPLGDRGAQDKNLVSLPTGYDGGEGLWRRSLQVAI